MKLADRDTLLAFLSRVEADLERAQTGPVHLFLLGETSRVFEGWCRWTDAIEVVAEGEEGDLQVLLDAMRRRAAELAVVLVSESPADSFPMPPGHRERARPISGFDSAFLRLRHFDPYGAAFRAIARGSEPDYHLVLTFLEKGWISVADMDAMSRDLLPRLEEGGERYDAAEMRRRYGGLLQMWRKIRPGTLHRTTSA